MFRKIERSLALQFTGFVFLLLMINGAVFLASDVGNAIRQMKQRLESQMSLIQNALPDIFAGSTQELFIPHVERLRILDSNGDPVFTGELFEEQPFQKTSGFSSVTIDREEFTLLTNPIVEEGQIRGYIQIAEPERAPLHDLLIRTLHYVLVSILISLLTYLVGRKFAKRSLKPAEEMLVRLERFTQDASHELRTPLAVLGSSLDLALKTGEHREGIVSAKEDLKKITLLVEKLLELARSGHLAKNDAELDASTLVRAAVDKFRPHADAAGVRLNLECMPNVTVKADSGLVHQILSNLLSNALKFSKKNDEISVSLNRERLIVSDTGIGIDRHDLPHIFERFYQADASRSKGGFGLGLSFVKQIVDLHGWTIDVKSEPKKGTTFTVSFGKKNHRNS